MNYFKDILTKIKALSDAIVGLGANQTVTVTEQEAMVAGDICVDTSGGFIPESSLTECIGLITNTVEDADFEIGGNDTDFAACWQGAGRIITAFKDASNSNYLTVRIIELNAGRTVKEIGAEYIPISNASTYLSIADTGNNTFVLNTKHSGNTGQAYGGRASGVEATFSGATGSSASKQITYNDIISHDLYSFAIVFHDTSNTELNLVAGTINPNTLALTFGTEVDVQDDGNGDWNSICKVEKNKVAMAWSGTDVDLWSCLATIAADRTITLGTPDEAVDALTINSASTSIDVLDSTHVSISYGDSAATDTLVVIGEFSGVTFSSWGTPVVIYSTDDSHSSLVNIDSSHFYVMTHDVGTGMFRHMISVSGTTPTEEYEEQFANELLMSVPNRQVCFSRNEYHDAVLFYNFGSKTYLLIIDFIWQDASFETNDITGVAEDASGSIIVAGTNEGDASGLQKGITYFMDTGNKAIRKKDHAFGGQHCIPRVRVLDTDALKAI